MRKHSVDVAVREKIYVCNFKIFEVWKTYYFPVW